MDKYEYTVKTEKIKKLADKKDYVSAAKLADTIDWSKVQDVRSLSLAADAYERSKRYSDAKDLLCLAYELAPAGRRMLYRLTELSIKEGKMSEAEDFFREYRKLAPEDEGQFVLLYEMAVAKNEPLEKQITILEAYRKREFDERWAFELARLYSRAGNQKACVRLCDEIILWFGFGKYVDRAMALKQNFEPLTRGQLEKIEQRREQEARMRAERQERQQEERPKKKKKRPKKERATESGESFAVSKEEAAESGKLTEEGARALLYRTSEEIEKEIASTMEGVLAPAFERETAEEEPVSYADEIPPEKDWSDPVYSAAAAREEEAISFYSEEADKGPETERESSALMDEMLKKALITADQFDEDGFVPDLEKTREFVPPKVPEETRELKELSKLREEGMLPLIDLDCVRQTAEEEKPEAEVPQDKEEPSEDTRDNPDDTPREAEAEIEEPVSEEAPEEIRSEEESDKEQAEPEKEEPEKSPFEQLLDALPEGDVWEDIRASILKNSALEASPEKIPIPEIEEEEPIKYGPVFACILMESADVTKAVSRAIDRIKKKHNLLGTMASQAAKISGVRLNKKGMKNSLERLDGRDLIIEGAGVLETPLLRELLEELRRPTMDGIVVLTDEPEALHKLIRRCPGLERMSDYVEDSEPVPAPAVQQLEQVQRELDAKARAEEELRRLMEERARAGAERREAERNAGRKPAAKPVSKPESELISKEPEEIAEESLKGTIQKTEKEIAQSRLLTMQEFAQYIEKYAFEMECVLDGRAGLAIYAVAERMQEEGEELTEESARELADDAIYLAEKPSLRGVFSGKYDKNGYLILREHHFSE